MVLFVGGVGVMFGVGVGFGVVGFMSVIKMVGVVVIVLVVMFFGVIEIVVKWDVEVVLNGVKVDYVMFVKKVEEVE